MEQPAPKTDIEGRADPEPPGAVEPPQPTVMREDQVVNAVGFLSHPKVRSSASSAKRAFLQQKGLTEAEIDEAFKRVPESSLPAASSLPAQSPAPSGALVATAQQLHPAPYGGPANSSASPLQTQQYQALQQHEQQPVRWSQVVLGAGFAAAGAYAVKSLVWPYVHDTYAAWRSRSAPPPPSDDAAAVAAAIKDQTAELAASIQAIKELVGKLDAARPPAEGGTLTAEVLREELRAFAATLNDIAAPVGGAAAGSFSSKSLELELAELKGMVTELLKTPRSGTRTPTEHSAGVTPGSNASATQQRLPLGAPSPPARQEASALRDTRSAPGAAPAARGTANGVAAPASSGGHPASYMEVLEMLERGETPPNIRTDINDKPPDPNQPPPAARMLPLPKPWERSGSAASTPADAGTAATAAADEAQPASSISFSPVRRQELGAAAVPSSSSLPLPSQSPSAPGSAPASPLQALHGGGNRRVASSIYEAATRPRDASPSVIAGRLSPAKPPEYAALSVHTGPFTHDEGPAVHASAAADTGGRSVPSTNSGMPDGAGLGRPSSRGWKPPPLPVYTLSGGGVPSPLQEGGVEHSASVHSLGDDFSSA